MVQSKSRFTFVLSSTEKAGRFTLPGNSSEWHGRMSQVFPDKATISLAKIIPRTHALIGKMVNSLMLPVFSRFDGVNDQSGQIGGISRRSHLVKYDIQLLSFHCQTLYGLYKMIPESRIQPAASSHSPTVRWLRSPISYS